MYYPILKNMPLESFVQFMDSKIISDCLKKINKIFQKMGPKYVRDINCDLTKEYQIIVEEIKNMLSFCGYDENFSYKEIESIFLFYAYHYQNTDSTLIKFNFINWFQTKYIETDKNFLTYVRKRNLIQIQEHVDELKTICRLSPNEKIQKEIDRLGEFLATLNQDETSPGDIKK